MNNAKAIAGAWPAAAEPRIGAQPRPAPGTSIVLAIGYVSRSAASSPRPLLMPEHLSLLLSRTEHIEQVGPFGIAQLNPLAMKGQDLLPPRSIEMPWCR